MDGVEEARVTMEAGYCWRPLYDRLEGAGYDIRLAHLQKVKAMAEAKTKNNTENIEKPIAFVCSPS